ncbi:putative oligopeptide transporter, OPT family [Actinobaculum suis]|uniref:Putative oligopeptide transporter, OPT family n=1 Tax=Actinobaculum suis TaxID=1657 RepID=A0A1G6ZTS7_9ACTO|nr:putative oligopeptide transporter, OPT family [Actinobaculum suis]
MPVTKTDSGAITPINAGHTARNSTPRELTFRAVVIGGIITLVFTAANVYLGLKSGLTFATSIPAAVISMVILARTKHTIQENNIVQTIASAAGTLSAIIFVIPGLVMIGWWAEFPFWTTVAVCLVGGVLGVMYSIPLRRALVTHSDLKYPEGVAAAEVLKVGASEKGTAENKRGMWAIITGGLASAAFSILSSMKLAASNISGAFKIGAGGTSLGFGFSFALIGIGHLVGLGVGVAMIVGVVIGVGVLLPTFSQGQIDPGNLSDSLSTVFSNDVRFVGAGVIAVAAVWALIKVLRPIYRGIRDSVASSQKRAHGEKVDLTEQDIPARIVGGVILVCMVPIAFLLWDFIQDTVLRGAELKLIAVSVIVTFLIGILVAAVCGYMAGLIGSSNSPISGVGILVVLLGALIMRFTYGPADAKEIFALTAFTLFVTSIIFGIATISNDNLQDLKTGQLVGATPWKQQVALVIGVVFGSLIIPVVLNLMANAFGFQGMEGAGKNALAAPQATLISSLAAGVLGGTMDWSLLGLGAIIGIVIIIIDEVLKAKTEKLSLPALAVGMGIYLPMSTTVTIAVGAVIGALYDRWVQASGDADGAKKRTGTLLATGFIVGESLWGVINAAIIGFSGNDSPLAVVGDSFAIPALFLGIVLFCGAIFYLYRTTAKKASAT